MKNAGSPTKKNVNIELIKVLMDMFYFKDGELYEIDRNNELDKMMDYSPRRFITFFENALLGDKLLETASKIITNRQILNEKYNDHISRKQEITFKEIDLEKYYGDQILETEEESESTKKLTKRKHFLCSLNPNSYAFPMSQRFEVNATYRDMFRIENEFLFTVVSILELIYLADKEISSPIERVLTTKSIVDLLNDEDKRFELLQINPNLKLLDHFSDLDLCSMTPNTARNLFGTPQKDMLRPTRQILRGCILLYILDRDLLNHVSYSELHKAFNELGLTMPSQTNFNTSLKKILIKIDAYNSRQTTN